MGSDVLRLNAFRRPRSGIYLVPDKRGIFPGTDIRDHLWLSCPSRKRPLGDTIATVFDLFPVWLRSGSDDTRVVRRRDEEEMLPAPGDGRAAQAPVLLLTALPGLAPMMTQTVLRKVREMASHFGLGCC